VKEPRTIGHFATLAVLAVAMFGTSPTALAASQVVKVSNDEASFVASDDDDAEWSIGQELCVIHKEREIACGVAEERLERGVLVNIANSKEQILEGDEVRMQGSTKEQTDEATLKPKAKADTEAEADADADANADAAQEAKLEAEAKEEQTEIDPENMNRIQLLQYHRSLIGRRVRVDKDEVRTNGAAIEHGYNLTIGPQFHANAGNDVVGIDLHFQNALTPEISIGLQLSYFKFNTLNLSNATFGGFITLEYSPFELYNGPFIRLAGGYLSDRYTASYPAASGTGDASDSAMILSAYGLVGWRLMMGTAFNACLGLGAQYLKLTGKMAQISTLNPNASGIDVILPMAVIEFGFSF
jgi:hypothetical protein